ncbi:hypothetical protein COLO4_28383 [Corchorus olitorius]|uniref:TF-B3 domain-containing protein n=1 Tax=Corchorus olitorius TaxID=93759 RepID=A0A1R3HL46_9ROSI|nr:hypothetical protein COLO4_28383 [Corchorus olitorius]
MAANQVNEPIQFEKIMTPAMLRVNSWLNPGRNFLEAVPMTTSQICNFLRRERSGYVWEVHLMWHHNLLVFRTGWPAFARAMRLRSGDLCTFTFVERDEDGVVIIHAERTPSRDLKKREPSPPKIRKIVKWGEGDREETLPSHIFREQRRNMPSSLFVQDRKGSKWPVKFEIRRNSICYLTEGWSEFWDAHHIKGGDFICFEFDYRDTLKCRIYCRCTKEADDYESDGRHLVNPHPPGFFKEVNGPAPETGQGQNVDNLASSSRETITPRTADVDLGVPTRCKSLNQAPKGTPSLLFPDPCIPDAVRAFRSTNPHWIRLMKHRYIDAFPIVNFLNKVSSKLPSGRGTITLYVAGQQHSKSWEVNCINEPGHFIGFAGGWGAFVRDNGLKIGDCCVFEVIADRKMRISIFPFK